MNILMGFFHSNTPRKGTKIKDKKRHLFLALILWLQW